MGERASRRPAKPARSEASRPARGEAQPSVDRKGKPSGAQRGEAERRSDGPASEVWAPASKPAKPARSEPQASEVWAPARISRSVSVAGAGVASDYARRLLADLGLRGESLPGPPDPHPALAWARCGAMALCGAADAPPRVPSGPLASCADGVGRALVALGARAPSDTAALLGERAAIFDLSRRGRISPGGSCRLLRAADGWAALSLSRDADVRALPAWLEAERGSAPVWEFAARLLRTRRLAELDERARWLGLPFAAAAPPPRTAPAWVRVAARGRRREALEHPPRVLDFSALWAGPLCGQLLAEAGAEVIKVEGRQRPDGARAGPAAFYDQLNAGKRSVLLDFAAPRDLALRDALLETADVVIESSRPRALAQLGIDAEAFVAARPGRVWLCITGYGRDDPAPGRVAFGDDAGVAAGLASAVADADGPLFCADAIADPLTGLHAALAVWATWRAGGGALLDVSLREVAAHAQAFAVVEGFEVSGAAGAARVAVGDAVALVCRPRARAAARRARAAGADTEALRRELG